MIHISMPAQEYYDEQNNEFITIPAAEFDLEHSLASISKWESMYEKPFLDNIEKHSNEEMIYYFECMCLTPGIDPKVFKYMDQASMKKLEAYLAKKHTATWFNEAPGANNKSNSAVTSEIIYYMMVALNIPFECETWNIQRLLTLIRVINAKNQPAKKMNRVEAAERAREINRKRREELGVSG